MTKPLISAESMDGPRKSTVKWIAMEAPAFRPLWIVQSRALKALRGFDGCACARTRLHNLMPQNRPGSVGDNAHLVQDQHRVWYFFHGTLADGEALGRRFGSFDGPIDYEVRLASITGGILTTWNGQIQGFGGRQRHPSST